MTLIYELKQRVVHTSWVLAGRAMQWGDISGIHVKIQIFRLLRLIL